MPAPATAATHDEPTRLCGLVLLAGFGLPALAAATEVLQAAAGAGLPRHEVLPLSPAGGPVQAEGGLAVLTLALAAAPALDAVFVLSGEGLPGGAPGSGPLSPALADLLRHWLQRRAAEGVTLGGLGSGAWWLADAGLLRGYRATVHWPQLAAFAESHADTVVSRHCYEIDRGRLSAAGHAAAADLLVAWLGQRHGERAVQALLQATGMERLRPRDERQREHAGAPAGAGSAKLAEALALMQANLGEPLPTEDIARLVGVSRRQLERLFKQHLDALPSRWYAGLRLSRARRLLQQTSQSILQIGLSCGFASGPHFSNAYRAHFGHTPRDERSQRAAAWRQGPTATATAAAAAFTEIPNEVSAPAAAATTPSDAP